MLSQKKQLNIRHEINNQNVGSPLYFIFAMFGLFVTQVNLIITYGGQLAERIRVFPERDSVSWILISIIVCGFIGWCFTYMLLCATKKNYTIKSKVRTIILIIFFLPAGIGYTAFNVLDSVPDIRGPYLSWTTDPKTSMTITWETKKDKEYTLDWGKSPEDLDLSAETMKINQRDDGYFHYTATISGLAAGSQYFYRIMDLSKEIMSFRTAPDKRDAIFKFILYGDSREQAKLKKNQHYKIVEQMLTNSSPEDIAFVINTGDIAGSRHNVISWDLHFDAIRELASSTPYFVASGNHEWDKDNLNHESQMVNQVFEFPSVNDPGVAIGSLNETSFSFGYGDAYFILIGFPHAASNDPDVILWIKKQLEIARQSYMFTFVMFHKPPFNAGTYSVDYKEYIQNLCPLLHAEGVDIVVNGHMHTLARHKITWAHDTVKERYVTYLTTAGGGADLYDYEGGTWDNNYGLGFSGATITFGKYYHYYEVTCEPSQKRCVFIAYNEEGEVVDQFEQYAFKKTDQTGSIMK